jgi:hypothetical protein
VVPWIPQATLYVHASPASYILWTCPSPFKDQICEVYPCAPHVMLLPWWDSCSSHRAQYCLEFLKAFVLHNMNWSTIPCYSSMSSPGVSHSSWHSVSALLKQNDVVVGRRLTTDGNNSLIYMNSKRTKLTEIAMLTHSWWRWCRTGAHKAMANYIKTSLAVLKGKISITFG